MIAKKILKATRHFHGRDCDSGLYVFTVRSRNRPTPEDLHRAGIRVVFCNHEHDCCGCWQYSRPFVERRNKRNEWKVTQSFCRNV